jgi:hypothetical protein
MALALRDQYWNFIEGKYVLLIASITFCLKNAGRFHMKIFYKLLPIALALFLTISFSCNTTEPTPPSNGTLSISLTDVSCTEAWVNLKANGVAFPVTVNFIADGSTVAQLNNLSSSDTTVYIDSLLPNKTYNIQAVIQSTNQYQATNSNKLAVQTLDTTSSNFIWQIYTFGASNAGSSSLNDVAIINDNDIWAVGSIYMDDSTGQVDPTPYCMVHWDGSSWKLLRLKYFPPGSIGDSIGVISTAIFANSGNDIWMTGGAVFHYDGIKWDPFYGTNGAEGANKIWGDDNGNVWFVGGNGLIVYYNGNTWQKIVSGTTTALNDIWGYYDQADNNLSVMTVASNVPYQGDYRLLAISDNTAKDTLNWPYTNWLKGVWFQGKYSPVYVCGSGVKEYQQGQWNQLNLPNYFTESIRGSAVNDVIAVGDYGFLTHFNGVRWNSENLANNYVFLSVAIKNNTVAIAGLSTSGTVVGSAIIVIGKR